jgi:hypothetical protein
MGRGPGTDQEPPWKRPTDADNLQVIRGQEELGRGSAAPLALLAVSRKGVAGLAAATFAGGALAAAASVKLLAVTSVVPMLAIVLRRPLRRLVVVAPPVAARLPGEHPIEVRIYLPRVTRGEGGTGATAPHVALCPAPQLHFAVHRSYAGSPATRDAKASTS